MQRRDFGRQVLTTKRTMRPTVLTIAGFDPSCGAGIAADLKTIAANGAYGIAAVTALTIQNTLEVKRLVPVDAKDLIDQLDCIIQDIRPDAVKIGMLVTSENVEAVAGFLNRSHLENVVLDPILQSSTGTSLLNSDAVDNFISELIPLADCLTPNLEEASLLGHLPVTNLEQMKKAAKALRDLGCRAVVITGGHLQEPIDVLFDGESFEVFSASRIECRNTHGTGCAFSTAVACHLAFGLSLPDAVRAAKKFVSGAIKHSYPIGRGYGPLNHFFRSSPD
jgi:hydroxymethylpyrimidine/phosphomethylpyrimidine kinase